MKGSKGKKWIIAILVIAVILVAGLLIANKVIKGIETAIISGKAAHSTTATAIRKEYIRFDEKNHVYLNENGISIERQVGDEEWRVYYQISKFHDTEQSIASRLLKSEEERNAKGKQRFTILSKDQYNSIQVGDQLSVTWRGTESSEIEIIHAGKPKTSDIGK